jgi:hypothetical protein
MPRWWSSSPSWRRSSRAGCGWILPRGEAGRRVPDIPRARHAPVRVRPARAFNPARRCPSGSRPRQPMTGSPPKDRERALPCLSAQLRALGLRASRDGVKNPAPRARGIKPKLSAAHPPSRLSPFAVSSMPPSCPAVRVCTPQETPCDVYQPRAVARQFRLSLFA